MAGRSVNRSAGSLGIIGWGQFSELIVRHLAPLAAKTTVSSRRFKSGSIAGGKARFAPAEEVLSSDVVIAAIPSQYLEEYLKTNAKHLRPGALFVDVCSVKMHPVRVMKRLVPKGVSILGTHPLFGPGSASESIAGHRIMVCPVRIDDKLYNRTKTFLKNALGLKIIETTPAEHDRMMAYVLGLTQTVGRAAQTLRIPDTPLATTAYEDLLDMKRVQGGDSWGMYESIMLDNPYALKALDEFINDLQGLRRKLKR